MTAPTLNRDRRNLLAAIGYGRVHRTFDGTAIRRMGSGVNRRCDVAVREFEAAGWVELGDDRSIYALTAAGQAALDGAR